MAHASPREVLGQAVAVRAEEAEVLEAVVVANPVLVVQLQAQPRAEPVGDAAALAPALLEAFGEESLLEVSPSRPPADYQQCFDRNQPRSRHDITPPHRMAPGVRRKAEETFALPIRQT